MKNVDVDETTNPWVEQRGMVTPRKTGLAPYFAWNARRADLRRGYRLPDGRHAGWSCSSVRQSLESMFRRAYLRADETRSP